MKRILIIYFFSLLAVGNLFSQDADLQDRRDELASLRQDINDFENQLSDKNKKLQSAMDLVSGLNREIDLATGHLSRLQSQLVKTNQQIQLHTDEIKNVQQQIIELREVVKKRVVNYYKYGRRNQFKALVNSSSVQQANVWLKYQKMILENDQRNFKALLLKQEQLENEKRLLIQESQQKEALVGERRDESARLKKSRTKRQMYLNSLKDDTQYLSSHVRELKAAQNQIGQYIQENERKRLKPVQPALQRAVPTVQRPKRDYDFAALRGRLPWPVKGTVISHFGRYTHPKLKTVTENLGVEIKAALGTPVQTVDAGQVQTITWQRGRGNIIIIGHEDGFYTVYTHLAEINVNVADFVYAGDVIGTVGDSGSLHGPVLHFQIWQNTQNLDPEKWLK